VKSFGGGYSCLFVGFEVYPHKKSPPPPPLRTIVLKNKGEQGEG